MSNLFLKNGEKGKNNWWRYLITILLSWVVSVIISILLFSLITTSPDINSNPLSLYLLVFLQFTLQIILFYISVKFIHKKNLMSLVNTLKGKDIGEKPISWIKRIRWNRFLKGILIWFVFIFVSQLITYIIVPDSYSFNFNIENLAIITLLFIGIFTIQVTFEELFFRGYIPQAISLKIKSPIVIILISSLIFCIGHLLNGGNDLVLVLLNVFTLFLYGIMWNIFTLVENGLELAIGAHLANNFFGIVISPLINNSSNYMTMIIVYIVVFLIFFIAYFLFKKEEVLKALNI